jgi:UDP-glucose 4-epimerase
MKLFVTGGAGYIGSAAAQMLLEAGHQVTVYDSLITGHRQAIPDGARFVQGDLADAAALAAALQMEQYEAVLHFAAFIEAGESMADPGKYFRNNLVRSLELIEACASAGIERFVFSSSAAVYASSDAPLTEQSPLGPANVYGQTKLMIEQALSWYQHIYGLRYAALRYFNAAGALPERGEAHQPETHLIPLVLQAALGKRPQVMIYGTDYATPDGTCVRDYIHIADLVQAHLLALEGLAERDRLVLNLGNGAGYSVQQVIETARRITGRQITATPAPRRAGDPAKLVASADSIRQLFGWQPRHPDLESIIESAWQWHRTHPDGYGSRQF